MAEVVTESFPEPVRRIGIADRFAETGSYIDSLGHYGMSIVEIL